VLQKGGYLVRNDSIERSVNDSILTITDYFLQRVEQAKIQKEKDRRKIISREMINLHTDHPSSSNEEMEDAAYELYYALIKEHQPDLFVNGNPVEFFPVDKDKSSFQILHSNGQFYGVYKQGSKEAHKVTQVFHSKEEVLLNTFGTSRFERFRGYTFFPSKNGKAYSLKDNKQFRLNLIKSFKPQTFYENIEQARSFVVKDELKNDPKCREQAIHRTLEEYHIPFNLMGKTVTINSIYKDDEGVRISLEENGKERDIKLPDLAEKWMERMKENPRMTEVFDELVMGSRSIGEGFLAFYVVCRLTLVNSFMGYRRHSFNFGFLAFYQTPVRL
jgi:hypothetical protein